MNPTTTAPTTTPQPARIQLVLVSHTNAGKTTLARTLVGVDMGEVRDAAHVTTESESHQVLATGAGDRLLLWDTPGFGDSVRLFKRLGLTGNPVGWFMREVIDRYHDRPFWLSQQAMRTARDEGDVLLYLVNSSENPKDTGYLAPEMKILQWLEKPVVVLLNQMGPPRQFQDEQAEQARWQAHLAEYPMVKKVLALDAFARCWVHERVFFEAIGALIADEKQAGYQRLLEQWKHDNQTRFQAAMRVIARQIADAAADRQPVEPGGNNFTGPLLGLIGMSKQRDARQLGKSLDVLMTRINAGIESATTAMLALYRLDPGHAATINERVNQGYVVRAPVDTRQAGVLGGLLSGAATGLSADLIAGGLTFGAGALVGAIAGALTFSGAAWAFNATTDRDQAIVKFSDEFLRGLIVASVLRYLAVAHFGRGRGNFVEGEAPAFWQQEVEAELAGHEKSLLQAWRLARSQDQRDEAVDLLTELIGGMTSKVLSKLYPTG